MEAESGLASLVAATARCTLDALDAVNGAHASVLLAPDGGALKVAGSAAALIRFARAGESCDAIAVKFGSTTTAIDAAAANLALKIRASLEVKRHPGFVAHRTFLSGERVAQLASPLRFMFGRAAPLTAVVALVGLGLARAHDTRAPLPPYALWSGFGVALAIMFVHELGHAAACIRYGARVGPIGCAIYLIYPAFFCDVTHTWSLLRRERLVVDLGGAYLQLVVTAVVAAVWWCTGSVVLLAAVRISTATMVLNLMPLGRLDGYWILSDVLGIVDLRGQQRRVVRRTWAKLRGRASVAMPWSWWTTLAILGYAIASAWFVTTIVLRFLPHVAIEVIRLPERIGALANATNGWSIATTIFSLLSSVVLALVAVMIVRQLIGSALRIVRRAAHRGPPRLDARAP